MLIERIVAGAVSGGLVGLLGGIIGGGVAGYFSPIAWISMNKLPMVRTGSENGARSGAIFFGVLAGATAGAIGHVVPLIFFMVAAGVLFGFAAWYFVQGIERIDGFVWGAIGGATLGAGGGYAGIYFLGVFAISL